MVSRGPLMTYVIGTTVDSWQLHHVRVPGCDVVTDEEANMNLFACGLMIPDESLEFNHWMTNVMQAGHRSHHRLGHPNHTEDGDAGWGFTILLTDDVAQIFCPGTDVSEAETVEDSNYYQGLPEPRLDWLDGLENPIRL